MLNHANPALASGSNNGRTLVLLLPSSNPPPWTRMAAGNGPGPSGMCRSSSTGLPPGLAYSTSFLSTGAPVRVAAEAIARMRADLHMQGDSIRTGGDQHCRLAGIACEGTPDCHYGVKHGIRPVIEFNRDAQRTAGEGPVIITRLGEPALSVTGHAGAGRVRRLARNSKKPPCSHDWLPPHSCRPRGLI